MSTILSLVRLLFVLWLLTTACRSGKKSSDYKLDDVRKNMTMAEVTAVTGEPSQRDDLGIATDENGDTTHIVIWRFGDNEAVTFINGKVDDVDTDLKATRQRLEEIMDSAKRASGQTQ